MRLVLLGPPGSGKGTQAKWLKARYGIAHLSTGEMLRASISEDGELAREIRLLMESGELVPDDLVVRMIEEKITRPECEKGFVLDGCPRTLVQAETLDQMLSDKNMGLNLVIEMTVDPDEVIRRISGRFSCMSCGASYHVTFNKPLSDDRCDYCGHTEFEKRSDDSEETVRRRLDSYWSKTATLVSYYRHKALLQSVDSMKPVNTVSLEIGRLISNYIG